MTELTETYARTVFDATQKQKFDYKPYPISKNKKSGLTKQAGLYLLVNDKTKKIYLGGSNDLAQRKGEHARDLKNQQVQSKILADLKLGSIKDFYFVPLVMFPASAVMCSNPKDASLMSTFLDLHIEKAILEKFLDKSSEVEPYLYNTKPVGVMLKGNPGSPAPLDGSPRLSGTPSKPVTFEGFAWESNRAVEKSTKYSTKSVRLKTLTVEQQKQGLFGFRLITREQYDAFSGTKISNIAASAFFDDKPEELKALREPIKQIQLPKSA